MVKEMFTTETCHNLGNSFSLPNFTFPFRLERERERAKLEREVLISIDKSKSALKWCLPNLLSRLTYLSKT